MKIKGVELINYKSFIDSRGKSIKLFQKDNYIEDFSSDEIFISESKKNVIRGLHFQPYPYGQRKIITVLKGAIDGIVLDLRKNSDTYGEYINISLDEDAEVSLYIPEYCAWGFHALGEKNILIYNISGTYRKEYDKGIYWNSIGYNWNIEKPITSDRDEHLIKLKQYMERENVTGINM